MIRAGLASNPFSGGRFAPGELPWLADDPCEIERLADRALASGARHQVLGVHGSGKSTLLAHLARSGERRGADVVRFRGSHGVPVGALAALAGARTPRVVFVDEVGELGLAGFVLVRAIAAALGASLVASTHRDLGLPTLLHARVSRTTAARVIAHLAPDAAVPCDVDRRLLRHGGNLREVLFELYDDAERAHAAAVRS